MNLRECAGAINRAKAVYVWVWLDPNAGEDDDGDALGGLYVKLAKESTRDMLAQAKENGLTQIAAIFDDGDLYIDEINDEEDLENDPDTIDMPVDEPSADE